MQEQYDYDEYEYEHSNSVVLPGMIDLYYQSNECLKLVNRELENRLEGKNLSEMSLTEVLLLKCALHLSNIEDK